MKRQEFVLRFDDSNGNEDSNNNNNNNNNSGRRRRNSYDDDGAADYDYDHDPHNDGSLNSMNHSHNSGSGSVNGRTSPNPNNSTTGRSVEFVFDARASGTTDDHDININPSDYQSPKSPSRFEFLKSEGHLPRNLPNVGNSFSTQTSTSNNSQSGNNSFYSNASFGFSTDDDLEIRKEKVSKGVGLKRSDHRSLHESQEDKNQQEGKSKRSRSRLRPRQREDSNNKGTSSSSSSKKKKEQAKEQQPQQSTLKGILKNQMEYTAFITGGSFSKSRKNSKSSSSKKSRKGSKRSSSNNNNIKTVGYHDPLTTNMTFGDETEDFVETFVYHRVALWYQKMDIELFEDSVKVRAELLRGQAQNANIAKAAAMLGRQKSMRNLQLDKKGKGAKEPIQEKSKEVITPRSTGVPLTRENASQTASKKGRRRNSTCFSSLHSGGNSRLSAAAATPAFLTQNQQAMPRRGSMQVASTQDLDSVSQHSHRPSLPPAHFHSSTPGNNNSLVDQSQKISRLRRNPKLSPVDRLWQCFQDVCQYHKAFINQDEYDDDMYDLQPTALSQQIIQQHFLFDILPEEWLGLERHAKATEMNNDVRIRRGQLTAIAKQLYEDPEDLRRACQNMSRPSRLLAQCLAWHSKDPTRNYPKILSASDNDNDKKSNKERSKSRRKSRKKSSSASGKKKSSRRASMY